MRRLYLLGLLIGCFLLGCTPTQVAQVPTATLQGAIVPTRAPTTALDPTAALAEPPTSTLVGVTAQANLPTDTMAPSQAPTDTPTNTSQPTDTPTLTNTPSPIPSDTPTESASETTTSTDTMAPSQAPTDTPTNTSQPTDTPTLTNTPSPTDTPVVIVTPPATPNGSSLYANSTALVPVSIESTVTAFSSLSSTIDASSPLRLYTYAGIQGEVLNISLQNTSGDLDPFLMVIDPKGRELVRNDDESSESLNSSVRGVRLPESGNYVIVASRYGQQFGSTTGDFDLSITKTVSDETPFGVFSQPIAYGAEATGTINDDQLGYIYTFRGNSGDTISIQMISTSGDLDSHLSLTDNLGNTLVSNDDDLVNGVIDSYIQNYILPTSGYFSIFATHYTGASNSGDFQLTVTLEEAGTPGEIHPIYAVLNPENSRTLRADRQYFVNYSAGDSADEDKNELRTDTLLTFFVPPLPEGVQLESASFDVLPCYETGSGFAVLRTLTIYNDNYGSLTEPRDFTHASSGARVLAEVDQCGPLDITDVVNDAYANGSNTVQLRLTFRDPISNGQGDEVFFTPHLLLSLGG